MQESGFPTVNQQKCIRHGRLFSNCVNCRDACPDEAISLVDNQIQLNASDCRDCGLCAAACPEQAIEVKHRVNRVVYQEKPLALIACIKTVKTADKINPQLHCIHELNSAALADLYLSNTRTIVTTIADCQHCELNRQDRFTESLDLFNAFLGS
ncbi:MAG: 4Fe-4S binding protein, partial [Gammaproteobacteria bacterium]|nr:4Fe-4S binding protein [Gammaproteobacteria bacterium]